MAQETYRTQILLEPEQHKALAEMAQREGRSISEIVRKMLHQQLEQFNSSREEAKKRQLAALERIRQHKEEMLAARGGKYIDFDVIGALNQAREEQDERNFALLNDAGD